MKLLENTKNKITKDKNGKDVSHLEITEVVVVHSLHEKQRKSLDADIIFSCFSANDRNIIFSIKRKKILKKTSYFLQFPIVFVINQ